MTFDPISSVAELATAIVSRVWPDKTDVQKQQFALELQRELSETQLLKSQSDTNTKEAEHASIFVAGWRPFIGWVCGASFAWQYVALPICLFVATATGHPFVAPAFDVASMTYVLMGMLGLGTMRSFEKIKKK